ncbi:MAG: cell division protein FtsZ [Fibrobacteria bacterium]|nr:cell division protein FtsZ [Fibrobacteria bacterium]
MQFAIDDTFNTVAKMKVVGVGGAGGNAVNRMVQTGMDGVEFIAVNTDAMALDNNMAHVRLQIGEKITGGLGAGANPQIGMKAMEEDKDKLRAQLEGSDMVFITAGMGGGTGTGAAPVVAEIARELDILSVGVVTKPFAFEGPVRDRNATAGLDALRSIVDTIIVIPNQKLLSIIEKTTTFRDAFKMADQVLTSATRGISEIILRHGDIQVDFADVKAIMKQGGDALMGSGLGAGENRAVEAADRAIHSPLLDDVSISGAGGVLVNIAGGEDLGMLEVNDAMNYIYEAVGTGNNANIIFGTVIDPQLKDEVCITVIATGFGEKNSRIPKLESRDLKPDSSVDQRLSRITESDIKQHQHEHFRQGPPVQSTAESTGINFGSNQPELKAHTLEQDEPVAAEVVRAVQEQHPSSNPAVERPEKAQIKKAADKSSRISSFDPSSHGAYSPGGADIDYETPAFLRYPSE